MLLKVLASLADSLVTIQSTESLTYSRFLKAHHLPFSKAQMSPISILLFGAILFRQKFCDQEMDNA